MSAKIHPFKLGGFECLVIQDQSAVMPLGNLVANADPEQVKQVALELGLPAEGITVGYNCLLVRTGKQDVLIDAGYGHSLKGREGALLQGLQAAGIEAEQIDRIVITHADRDHIGGIFDEQGAFVYPNAEYVLWQGAWDFWQNEDNYREWPWEIVAFIRGTILGLEPRLTLVDADEEFLAGFQLIPAVGHRHDHVVLKIASQNEQLLHLADAVTRCPIRHWLSKSGCWIELSPKRPWCSAPTFPFPAWAMSDMGRRGGNG
jgi:glyoxylase-like metal-dependent hydrolase (beta-lactamase superfamily II)